MPDGGTGRADGRQGRRRARARGRDDALRALCAQIAEAGARHPLLVVPGGAQFADAVRAHDRRFRLRPQTAHWMAILAMDQFGWALSDLIPGAARCDGSRLRARPWRLDPAARGPPGRARPASRVLDRHVGLDRRVGGRRGRCRATGARQGGGRPLPHLATGRRPIPRLTVDELAALAPAGVDAYLPAALRAAGVETWVIGGRDPARLSELLDEGHTAGTQVIASAR